MANQRYVVKSGDTLWNLAEKFLGAPTEWPRLYAFNNEPEVVRITGSRIDDPDVLHVGQTLMLPILPGLCQAPPTTYPKVKKPSRLRDNFHNATIPFTVKYKLDDLSLIKSEGPGFSATVKLTGDLAVTLAHEIPVSYVLNRGLEMSYKAETDRFCKRLISEAGVSWDEKSNRISYSCTMIRNGTKSGAACSSIGVEISSNKPVPVLRAEIHYPKLTGMINGNMYCAVNVKAVVELEPKKQYIRQKEPVNRQQQPVEFPANAHAPVSLISKGSTVVFLAGAAYLTGQAISYYITKGGSPTVNHAILPLALSQMGFVVKHEIPGQIPVNIIGMVPDVL